MDSGVYRIIDANLNRVMEGIRVCEDIIRFSSDNESLTRKLKDLRHEIFGAIRNLRKEHLKELLCSRDPSGDVGIKTSNSERTRENLVDLFLANSQRGKESLRVLEEVLKLLDNALSHKFKTFRFSLYEIEKTAVKELGTIRDIK
ncbi:MAG: thiamine-phosphate pyrophosphorylase [Candidatus Omnitrophica bacterium]|jgi:thiamine-phosphate pyrophosphorylase|nr:thiamine-phosphate pyrophosphorylase [Candidatus Omnitrophota bacterium]MDD4012661.1 thiamine-phosphate pyrophosphorylase [Candidatus Omnitrophota bacterium]